MTSMDYQIKQMLANHTDRARCRREQGSNPGWHTPIGCLWAALAKIGRVLKWDSRQARMTAASDRQIAEECREAAHYLLRCASLLDEDDTPAPAARMTAALPDPPIWSTPPTKPAFWREWMN